jgi:hypothetical protein
MKICSIERNFIHADASDIGFNSSRTILEFDAVFIDSAGLEQHRQNPRALNFRRAEFSEFLALGRTIVVFTASLNLESFIPIQALGLKSISGSRVDFKGPDYLKVFWQSVQQDMQFLAYFEKNPGQPFLFIPDTNKAVATLIKLERGNFLLLPWLKPNNGTLSVYQERCARFMIAFQKLNEHLSPKKPAVSLPAWSADYGWERERKLSESLVSLKRQSEEISNQINKTTTELEIEDNLKVLFTGKSDVLVDTVVNVFTELGAKLLPVETGRDDIILEFEGKHAVVEVKGKKNSAAESDAAQLEKWVAGFKEEKGTDPKGILLINAYCETLLVGRTEPAFPHQMLKYSKQREHCLITTTQLLGLLLEVRAHPEKRIELLNSFFSTVGVYQQFTDWKTFLIPSIPASAKTE